MLHRSFFAGILAVVLLSASPAAAAEWKPFSAAGLAQAQKDGGARMGARAPRSL